MEIAMTVNEAIALATRIEAVIERCKRFEISQKDTLAEIHYIANDLRDYADNLDRAMYEELASAYEKYDDAMLANGV
jgi:hypothetical protein